MSGEELRQRIKLQGWTLAVAAAKLGLTIAGLHKQIRGKTGVSQQTKLLLGFQEIVHNATEAKLRRRPRA